jgi:hypothetical protein
MRALTYSALLVFLVSGLSTPSHAGPIDISLPETLSPKTKSENHSCGTFTIKEWRSSRVLVVIDDFETVGGCELKSGYSVNDAIKSMWKNSPTFSNFSNVRELSPNSSFGTISYQRFEVPEELPNTQCVGFLSQYGNAYQNYFKGIYCRYKSLEESDITSTLASITVDGTPTKSTRQIKDKSSSAIKSVKVGNTRLLLVPGSLDKNVCKGAIQVTKPVWATDPQLSWFTEEAKRRGLSEKKCAVMTGRFSESAIESFFTPASSMKTTLPRQTSNRDIKSRLERLKDLQDSGLITKEEAAAKRREILKDL